MKILTIIAFLTLLYNFSASIAAAGDRTSSVPREYAGYMLYEAVDNNGSRVVVKKPVRYKIKPGTAFEDNDESYQYRNYRIEMKRVQEEREAREKINNENKKINSAAYYPLYLD